MMLPASLLVTTGTTTSSTSTSSTCNEGGFSSESSERDVNSALSSSSSVKQSQNQTIIIDPLQVEQTLDVANREQPMKNPKFPSTYVGLATGALLLTLTCPGNTLLWRQCTGDGDGTGAGTNGGATAAAASSTTPTLIHEAMCLDGSVLVQLLVAYIATLIALAWLWGTDPGYVTVDMMQRLDQEELQDEEDDDDVSKDEEVGGGRVPPPSRPVVEDTTTHSYSSSSIKTDVRCSTPMKRRTLSKENFLSSSSPLSDDGRDPLGASTLKDDSEQKEEEDEAIPLFSQSSSLTQERRLTHHRRKYCEICQLQPPLRAHHCKACQKCVASFDHHCHFIGTCIGERNHGRFVVFLAVQALAFLCCAHVVGSSSLGMTTVLFSDNNHNNKTNLNDDPMSSSAFRNMQLLQALWVVLIRWGYLYPMMASAFLVLVAHVWLVASNTTTFECAKHRHVDYLQEMEITTVTDLPFSQGLLWNVAFVFSGGGHHTRGFCPRHRRHHHLDLYRSCCYYFFQNNLNPHPDEWMPHPWKRPGRIVRDSPEWWNHLWQNKYWSCC